MAKSKLLLSNVLRKPTRKNPWLYIDLDHLSDRMYERALKYGINYMLRTERLKVKVTRERYKPRYAYLQPIND